MFQFSVSPRLVRRTINDLPGFGGLYVRYQVWRAGHSLDKLAPHWGKHVTSAIGTIAHRTRHALHEPIAKGVAADRFTVIQSGVFVKEVADCIEQYTCYIGADRQPMRDLAQELLEHLRTNGIPSLHPGAPVTRLELAGNTLVAHVRPYIPRPPGPDWVPATRIE